MADQVNFVSEINSKSMNWNLKVRVVRLWENPDRDRPDMPFSIELIVMDEKCDRIHASIGRSFIQRFKEEIKEMGLYFMKNFVVCINNMKLKIKDHKFKLMFTHKTTVEEIHDTHFNMSIFKFKTYDQVSNTHEFDNTELFDVIGEIVSYEDVQSIKQDDNIRMFMNIEIQDYETNTISATLWGDFVEQIKLYLNECNDKPVVIVMQLIRAHRYREQYSVRNTWHASKLWINATLSQVVDFSSRMVSLRGERSQRISQISSHKTNSTVDELASGNIDVKTIEDLSDCKHPGEFWVVATIVHVELDRGWCYLACKNCAKKVDKEGNKFYCKKCEQIQSPTHRYRLQVKVMDCTGTISLLLWDKDAAKIIGKSANDLKEVVYEEYGVADDSSCPIEIQNIVDKVFMFKLDVNTLNGKHQDDVFKVVKLTDDEEIIKKYIHSPREEAFKDPDFSNNEVSREDNEITDSTEDNELVDVANTPAKIAAVVEEDLNAQLSGNKIKRVFKKKKTA